LSVGLGAANTTTLTTNVANLDTTTGGSFIVNETNGIDLFAINANSLEINAGGVVSINNSFSVNSLDIDTTVQSTSMQVSPARPPCCPGLTSQRSAQLFPEPI
jgi:hypothetical protein